MSPGGFGVAVLGAGGIIARAIVRDLAESDEVSSLLLLDISGAAAERAAAEQGRAGCAAVRALAIDARDGVALAEALAGCRVLVNAASYRLNLVAMEAALAAGCEYLDLGGLYWMTARQLELHDRFARVGRLAVLGIGSSPGKTNVMAVRGVRELGGEGGLGARRRDRLDGRPRRGARAAARARTDSPRRRPPARALRRPGRHVSRA